MRLYHVQTSAYGSFGSVVVCDNQERAVELFLEKYPEAKRLKYISATLIADDLSVEFVQEEMVE